MMQTVATVATVANLRGNGRIPPILNVCRNTVAAFCDNSCDSGGISLVFPNLDAVCRAGFRCERGAGAGGPYTPLKGGYEARSVVPQAWGWRS